MISKNHELFFWIGRDFFLPVRWERLFSSDGKGFIN